MNDQAAQLRRLVQQQTENTGQPRTAKAIAVVSGKGGVGKSNVSVNFALSLTKRKKKVLLFDMDIGMGNIYHLLNGTSSSSILDYLKGFQPLEDVIQTGPENIHFIHGGSAFSNVFEWEEQELTRWLEALDYAARFYDYLLFDMGAGATNESLSIIDSADQVIVVSTPEPTSITDAYSMAKFIYLRDADKAFYILVNRADSQQEGLAVANRLKAVMQTYLHITPAVLGVVPEDAAVRKAVKEGVPFLLHSPRAPVSALFEEAVRQYAGETKQETKPSLFLAKIRRFFTERGESR